jgi:hypothetical protein
MPGAIRHTRVHSKRRRGNAAGAATEDMLYRNHIGAIVDMTRELKLAMRGAL